MPKDNQMEKFTWVDKNDQVIGSITRKEAHSGTKKIHRAVSIVLTNSAGKVLMQKRSPYKDRYPSFWTTSASGHVTFGQSYEETANRELKEEIGVDVLLKKDSVYLTSDDIESEYDALFVGTIDFLPNHLDLFEVELVKWLDKSEINELYKQKILTPPAVIALQKLGFIKT